MDCTIKYLYLLHLNIDQYIKVLLLAISLIFLACLTTMYEYVRIIVLDSDGIDLNLKGSTFLIHPVVILNYLALLLLPINVKDSH